MGYEIIVAQTLNNPDREAACIRRMLARQVDGLFIRPVYRQDAHAHIYDELKKTNIPTQYIKNIDLSWAKEDLSDLRWTVDEPEDLILINNILITRYEI